ncbi:hypothetical protein BB559_001639 [Furculomyces boomerangus]|uniref:Ubiquitin carboxyl-terminal hydrolase n=2 Tax=Harpellales TaxID=61421 RepID=A0A2T9Z183_9FUNG|nr:hypothetical protein BB559_001639 [Furculomyces boomerangus]PVZ98888.1 hypothetical protein BB558_005112 [Smittium angustum]
MVPQPSLSIIFLFPTTGQIQKERKEMYTNSVTNDKETVDDVYFLKQTIGNACGTIAIIHALANNLDSIDLGNFIEKTKDLDPYTKCKELENNHDFANIHNSTSQQGQTEPVEADSIIDFHFVAFTLKNGILLEMDGTFDHPISHGKCTSLIRGAADVIKKYMEIEPNSSQYSILSLGPPSSF